MNFTDHKPIFVQIAQLGQDNIECGEWVEGGRIPSTRELAVELAVNPATVIRAYEQLTLLSLVEQRRGLGYFVCEGASERVLLLRRREFFERTLPEFFGQLGRLSVTFEEVSESFARFEQGAKLHFD